MGGSWTSWYSHIMSFHWVGNCLQGPNSYLLWKVFSTTQVEWSDSISVFPQLIFHYIIICYNKCITYNINYSHHFIVLHACVMNSLKRKTMPYLNSFYSLCKPVQDPVPSHWINKKMSNCMLLGSHLASSETKLNKVQGLKNKEILAPFVTSSWEWPSPGYSQRLCIHQFDDLKKKKTDFVCFFVCLELGFGF